MGMYEARIQRVLAAMKAMGLDQMIVSDPDSIWYLTGYYVYPFERMLVLYLRSDGNHILFLNKLFPVPEAPRSRTEMSAQAIISIRRYISWALGLSPR